MLKRFGWQAIIVACAIVAPPHTIMAACLIPCATNSQSRKGAIHILADSGRPVAGNPENKNRGAITAEARDQAKELFESRCATCHGNEGRGDGPAASNLRPQPRNFHSRKWQKSITDETIMRAIVYGGSAVGVSGQMAPNPDLEDQPAVVAAIVERIRKWAR